MKAGATFLASWSQQTPYGDSNPPTVAGKTRAAVMQSFVNVKSLLNLFTKGTPYENHLVH
jgi:hypothetical protein